MPTAKEIDASELLERAGPSYQPRRGPERTKQLYIADDVFWCLNARVKALNSDGGNDHTADELASDILRQWCMESLPEIVKLRAKRDELYEQQKEIDKQAVKAASTTQ